MTETGGQPPRALAYSQSKRTGSWGGRPLDGVVTTLATARPEWLSITYNWTRLLSRQGVGSGRTRARHWYGATEGYGCVDMTNDRKVYPPSVARSSCDDWR